jgi:hypothetical protein
METACQLLAEARSIDEVKTIRHKAEAAASMRGRCNSDSKLKTMPRK